MGALFRSAALILGLGFLACMVAHTLSGDAIWRQRALFFVKWAVVLGLTFFGLLILRRAAVFI